MMKINYRKAFVLAGATLVVYPVAFLSYYGNLLPYLYSYLHAQRDQMFLYVDPLWPGTVFRCCVFVMMIFTSPLEFQFGTRPCIAAALVVLNISTLSGFFTIQEPLALTLIFGGTHGMAVGVIYTLTLKLLLQTMGKKGGLALGVMSLGPAIGALVSIGIAYGVINPSNKKADLKIDNSVYFSDSSVIHNVPYFFLVEGIVKVFTTSLGFLFLLIGSSQHAQRETETEDVPQHSSVNGSIHVREDIPLTPLSEKTKLCEPSGKLHPETKINAEIKLGENALTAVAKLDDATAGNQSHGDSKHNGDATNTLTPETVDMSPGQIVKTRRFWCVWLCFLTFCHPVYVHMNLYKQYGQLAISNDLTLVITGVFCTIGMIITRPFVGMFIDRFGIRPTVTYICAASSVCLSLMVLVIHTVPILYTLLAVLEFLCVSLHVIVFGFLTSDLFGKTHCASNMGLVCSGQILLIFLEPVFIQAMVRQFGWDWVFLSGAVGSAVATCAIIAAA